MISNLLQSSDEALQDFFECVVTCAMLSFKESFMDMKEFQGEHVACIEKATKLMCEQIIKRLFNFGLKDKTVVLLTTFCLKKGLDLLR